MTITFRNVSKHCKKLKVLRDAFSKNHDFLENAIKSSSCLLGKCLDHIIQWVNYLYDSGKDDKEFIDYCLSEYGDLTLMSHEKNFSVFIILVRKACVEQSAQGGEWWIKNFQISCRQSIKIRLSCLL